MRARELERAATVTPLSMTVSDEVRVLLARRRLREGALAEVLGVSATAVSTRMRGVKPWSLADLDALASFFEVDANTLLPALGKRAALDTHATEAYCAAAGQPRPHSGCSNTLDRHLAVVLPSPRGLPRSDDHWSLSA